LDREKALTVLREILSVLSGKIEDTGVILDFDKAGDCSLRLNFVLDEKTQQLLAPIMKKDKLTIRQTGDYIIIK
jgi:hypothetical protein